MTSCPSAWFLLFTLTATTPIPRTSRWEEEQCTCVHLTDRQLGEGDTTARHHTHTTLAKFPQQAGSPRTWLQPRQARFPHVSGPTAGGTPLAAGCCVFPHPDWAPGGEMMWCCSVVEKTHGKTTKQDCFRQEEKKKKMERGQKLLPGNPAMHHPSLVDGTFASGLLPLPFQNSFPPPS